MRTALFAVALAVVGCGSAGPALVEAEGTVTGPDGKPLANVLVQFLPDAPGHPSSSAVTDAAGKFTLTADNKKPGAVAGPHKVTVVDNALADQGEFDPNARTKLVNRVPTRYGTATTTPLGVTVEAGKRTYDLKVEW